VTEAGVRASVYAINPPISGTIKPDKNQRACMALDAPADRGL